MANYFTIDYEDSVTPASGILQLNDYSDVSHSLSINVSMFAGSGFTPTHYKLWGIEIVPGEGIVSSGTATWQAFPVSGKTTAYLNPYDTDPQYAFVLLKDASETETTIIPSNGVLFNFVDPIIDSSVAWKDNFSSLGYESATSNTLVNTEYKSEVELHKGKLNQLIFSGSDLSGLRVEENSIYVNPTSDLGRLITLVNSSHVTISKTFDTPDIRMLTVDYGNGPETLTTYDGNVKSTLSGTNLNRVDNILWDSKDNSLTFDAYKFSHYGFTTISKVEFTQDSQSGGYVGDTIIFKVKVIDSNGDLVENAPVTISGYGDIIGTVQESIPLNTDAYGIAEFSLPIVSIGRTYFSANVDGLYFAPTDHSIYSLDKPATQRSLLTQLEQIYKTETYSDTVSGVNTVEVAEPSGSADLAPSDSVIEHDLNVLRTLLKQVKGTDDWYSDLGNYFDPTNTDVANSETKVLNINSLKNNTLDSKTIILAVDESNSGSGFSVSVGDTGFLFNTSFQYATPSDRIGLPIFSSVTNSGTYYDEGGWDRVVAIDLVDMSNGAEFKDASGNIIFGKFHDGTDFGGSGDGTDVYVKFYTEAGEYTTVSGDPSTVMMVYPYRKTLDQMEEYEWSRTTFVSSWEGDAAIVEDIADLWSFVGTVDNEGHPSWTVIPGSPIIDSSILSLAEAINTINDSVGNRTWTTVSGYLTDGQSITDALDALDMGIKLVDDNISSGVGEVYIEIVSADILRNTPHTLPASLSYTPCSIVGQEGKNMDIFINGMLLTADTGVNGSEWDRDYAETSTTQITFHSDIYVDTNITYLVRQ